jgi:hypothetical protein
MAEENIGDFPIIISDLLQKEPNGPGLTQRSSVESAINTLLKQPNNPASNYYGHSAMFLRRSEAVKAAAAIGTDEAQEDADVAAKNADALIDARNAGILLRKNITGCDTAYVPPRIKCQMDTLTAYDSDNTPDKKIVRILVYDERAGSFNKLGNLVFSMINSGGIGRTLKGDDIVRKVEGLFTKIKDVAGNTKNDPQQTLIGLGSKREVRNIALNLYPLLTVGTEGSLITNATFSSQPSGDVGSTYLFTALQGGSPGTTTAASSAGNLIDDVFMIPSTITLSMAGNTCITRGQTYCVDFGTGTTLDNSYTVLSVTHSITPGGFKTNVTLAPTNSATMRSVARQVTELSEIIKSDS